MCSPVMSCILFYLHVQIEMKRVVFLLMNSKVLFNDSRLVSDVSNPGISFPKEVISESLTSV
jgi:hypothetical protein